MICFALSLLSLQMKAPVAAGKELDFWVGSWKVFVGKELAGTDTVVKSLDGFAITETWHGTRPGDEGMSLFYYMPAKKQWKQVWVTPYGAYKEKVSAPVKDGIRFQGTAFGPKGRNVADRTTLTKLSGGRVRQVIERAADSKTWKVGFDATYVKS